MLMTDPIRIVGLLFAAFSAFLAFIFFARIWHGTYTKPDSQGKAGFCTFRAFAIQGAIALGGAVLFAYFSLRHY